MIISGGNNVYPREVEEIIVQHPAVANVCVVGIPDPYWGEAVHAVVVTEPGAQVTAQELIAHCGQHLAGYKKIGLLTSGFSNDADPGRAEVAIGPTQPVAFRADVAVVLVVVDEVGSLEAASSPADVSNTGICDAMALSSTS